MKRFLALLLAALTCLSLAGCRKAPAPTPAPQPEPEPDPVVDPVRIDTLRVECTADGRKMADLLALQRELPDTLKERLEAQNYTLDSADVTFGTSAEATVQALCAGGVDLAFLPAETFFVHEEELAFLALESGDEKDLSRSVICAAAGADASLCGALRAALDGLSLPRYAGGTYAHDASALDPLRRATVEEPEPEPSDVPPTEDHVLTKATVHVDGYEPLTVELIGKWTEDGTMAGVCRIDVYDANYLIQSIDMKDAIDRDGMDGIERGYTACPSEDLLLTVGDVNFDGSDDLAVYGWPTVSLAPYYYFLWDPDTLLFTYGFSLQGLELDEHTKRVLSTVRTSAAAYRTDTYTYVNGVLTLISSEDFGPEIDAREAAMAYYESTVFTVEEMRLADQAEDTFVFSVTVSKGGEIQEPDRTITVACEGDEWVVTGEGY